MRRATCSSSAGAVRAATCRMPWTTLRREGHRVSLCHFNYIHPLPHGVREIFSRFKKIIVCELNEGQFANYLRHELQEFSYEQYNKCEGQPFTIVELREKFESLLK